VEETKNIQDYFVLLSNDVQKETASIIQESIKMGTRSLLYILKTVEKKYFYLFCTRYIDFKKRRMLSNFRQEEI